MYIGPENLVRKNKIEKKDKKNLGLPFFTTYFLL